MQQGSVHNQIVLLKEASKREEDSTIAAILKLRFLHSLVESFT